MLEARAVTVRYGARTAVDAASLTVHPGEIVVIVGPNGAGKSTLLGVLSGALAATSGDALLDGKAIAGMPPQDLAHHRAVLEQTPIKDLPFSVSALISLALPREIPPRMAREIEGRVLAEMDIAHYAGTTVGTLSGGEAHRTHLARVHAQLLAGRHLGHGRYLLIDEPTASLDLKHQAAVMRLARDAAAGGAGVLMILHDLTLTAGIADRVVLMNSGRIEGDGPVDEVLTPQRVERVYGIPVSAVQVHGQQAIIPHILGNTQPIEGTLREGDTACLSP